MNTIIVDPQNPQKSEIIQISKVLLNGGIVALPTDTVYGLVCRVDSLDALSRIYQLKGRKSDKPIPVFVKDIEQVIRLVDSIPDCAYPIMQNFWPGALTLVFPCHKPEYHEITKGTGKIGLRIPLSKLVLQLLEELRIPLGGTSANISDQNTTVTAEEVKKIFEISGGLDLIVDGGITGSCIASTVLDITDSPLRVLRSGDVTLDRIQHVLQIPSKKD